MNPKPTLLIVDDEANILKAFGRLLRTEPYRVLTASSGLEALDILQHETVHVVITDQKMPWMDGQELMEEMESRYPHLVKIALSGHVALPHISGILRNKKIFKFIPKPWRDEEVKQVITDAFRQAGLQNFNDPSMKVA
jgi:DNA-binding NtrC family response regulator